MGESVLSRLGQWISSTPLRSLDRAYEAALRIKAIEDRYFQGDPSAATETTAKTPAATFRSNCARNCVKLILV